MLEADSLRLRIGHREILSGIYLRLEAGQTVALPGTSGSGKSSLLHTIYGLPGGGEGQVRIQGRPCPDLYRRPRLLRLLPQESMTPKVLRVQTVLRHFGIPESRFAKDFPELKPLLSHRFSALSGGEVRLVELYCLLRQPAPYLLPDEPFRGMSPVLVEQFGNLLAQEQVRKAILFTDHQPTRAFALAVQVFLLQDGHVRRLSGPGEIG